jgi:hypothetical protein
MWNVVRRLLTARREPARRPAAIPDHGCARRRAVVGLGRRNGPCQPSQQTVEVVRPMMARMSGGKGLCIKHGRTSPGICAGVSVGDRVHATNWLGLRFHKSRIGSHAVEIMGLAALLDTYRTMCLAQQPEFRLWGKMKLAQRAM